MLQDFFFAPFISCGTNDRAAIHFCRGTGQEFQSDPLNVSWSIFVHKDILNSVGKNHFFSYDLWLSSAKKAWIYHRLGSIFHQNIGFPIFGTICYRDGMIVIGTGLVERYLAGHVGHKGIKAARSQYEAWLGIVGRAQWRNPEDVKVSYPKASILKAGRVVFNIKGNDYRLIAALQYRAGVVVIRFFGSHVEYDGIDAEIV